MDIKHHIGFSSSDKLDKDLKQLGIKFKIQNLPNSFDWLGSFEIKESHIKWARIKEIIKEKKILDITTCLFTNQEILDAEYSRILPSAQLAYPEPKATWVSTRPQFDNWCSKCGIWHGKQMKPFWLNSEPLIHQLGFIGIHWSSSIFTTVPILDGMKSAQLTGYETNPVLIGKDAHLSSAVKQVLPIERTKAGLITMQSTKSKFCSVCGNERYAFIKDHRMNYKRNSIPLETDFVETEEWFGDGAFSFRETFITNRVAQFILNLNYEGLVIQPITLV